MHAQSMCKDHVFFVGLCSGFVEISTVTFLSPHAVDSVFFYDFPGPFINSKTLPRHLIHSKTFPVLEKYFLISKLFQEFHDRGNPDFVTNVF